MRGGDRQVLHERLRGYSFEAQDAVARGEATPLIDRVVGDADFRLTHEEVGPWLDPKNFTGRSAAQVRELIREHVEPALAEIDLAAVEEPRV